MNSPNVAGQKTKNQVKRPKFCSNCGTNLLEDANFCVNCGARIKIPEPLVIEDNFSQEEDVSIKEELNANIIEEPQVIEAALELEDVEVPQVEEGTPQAVVEKATRMEEETLQAVVEVAEELEEEAPPAVVEKATKWEEEAPQVVLEKATELEEETPQAVVVKATKWEEESPSAVVEVAEEVEEEVQPAVVKVAEVVEEEVQPAVVEDAAKWEEEVPQAVVEVAPQVEEVSQESKIDVPEEQDIVIPNTHTPYDDKGFESSNTNGSSVPATANFAMNTDSNNSFVEKHQYPYLIRKKTKEKIMINQLLFRIGKEPSYCQYIVSDNNAVSRNHADIVSKDGSYFIIDNKSTNGTYVNEQLIPVHTEVKILSGANLTLADEDFIFYM